jgi:ribosomal-protein-alanine N-acetyltransferase
MKPAHYIRFATLDDLPELIGILQTSSPDWTPALLEDCFEENYFHWVVCAKEEIEEIKGFVVVRKNFDAWEIMQIVVDFQHQRQGLATHLLQFVIDTAKKNAMERVQLEVRKSNDAAITLYLQCGFCEVGMRKKYYPDKEDALLMDYFIS